MSRCLNCGADPVSAFCAQCGQRAVPADPTVSELAGDAWQELSGYDGRIAATFRGLLHPGRLTNDYLQGKRARYLSPVRLYLTVSVIYFVIAAAAPLTRSGGLQVRATGGGADSGAVLTDEDRASIARELDEAPSLLRPMMASIQKDPAGFRARTFTIMPRVFFALLPVFAATVWLFYRRRRFPVALVFAVHLHTFAFVVFSISEAAKFAGSDVVATVVAVPVLIAFAIYALLSLRAVFGGGWLMTIVKAAGIALVYGIAAVPAFLIVLIWAALV